MEDKMDKREKQELRELNQIVNQVLWDMLEKNSFNLNQSDKLYFPGGLKYKYWKRFKRKPHYREWLFCYSSTKNANGKYVSWIYWPITKDEWNTKRAMEHKRKKDAINRAYKLSQQFKKK